MKGYILIWSGEKDMKKNGVQIEIKARITQIDYISCWIIQIKTLLKGKETKIIQICALQVGCQDDEKMLSFRS